MSCDPGCSSFLLFCLATIATFMAELCFVPVLALVKFRIPDSNETFCWSWNFVSPNAENDKMCPFLLLFLTTLLLGLLLIITFLYIMLKKCTDGVLCCRFLIKYGTFGLNFVSFLLVMVFIILIIVFTDSEREEIRWTGAFLNPHVALHYRFTLVCVGTFLTLLATVLSGVIAFRHIIRSAADEYRESGVVQSFADYSKSEYEQIN